MQLSVRDPYRCCSQRAKRKRKSAHKLQRVVVRFAYIELLYVPQLSEGVQMVVNGIVCTT